MRDHAVRSGEDRLGGAVVFLEAHHGGALVVLVEVEDILDDLKKGFAAIK